MSRSRPVPIPSDAILYGAVSLEHLGGAPVVEVDEDGTRYWRNAVGELHRVGGPAVIRPNGAKEWWRNGRRVSEDEPGA